MAHIRLLVIVIVAAFYYASFTDTAAVRSEIFSEELQRIAQNIGSKNVRTQRGVITDDEISRRICSHNTPCGWEVYVPFTRRMDYYMKNTCNCPDISYKCVRTDDDLSVSAYVYRCRQNTTSDDIESPQDGL